MATARKQRSTSQSTHVNECNVCLEDVKGKHKAMACEICEKWYHIECQNISEQVYEFLVKEGNCVHWFCDKCNGAAAKIYKMVCAVKVKHDEIETKVDFVTEKVELLENAMEAKMDAKIAELRRDQEEIEKRRTNLIIYEVAESNSPDSGERKRDDEHKVRSIFRKLQVQEPDVKSVSRLGKKQDGNFRPVKVVFGSERNKQAIMNRVKSLRISKQKDDAEVLKDIHIAPDMTQRQREERRGLMKELEKRKQEGEKDLVIRNGRIVPKKIFWREGNSTDQAGPERKH